MNLKIENFTDNSLAGRAAAKFRGVVTAPVLQPPDPSQAVGKPKRSCIRENPRRRK